MLTSLKFVIEVGVKEVTRLNKTVNLYLIVLKFIV